LVLKVVAWTLQGTLREIDSVARLGGDEFALLLPETHAENARLVLDKLQNALKNAMTTYQWAITFSVGVVTFKTPPSTAEYMIDMADKTMLVVKKTGKNRVSYLALD
jgi:diguanylate cyclase (GGDEF)-like protein